MVATLSSRSAALRAKPYLPPAGVSPHQYMQQLSAEAGVFNREENFQESLRVLQKRLAVVSHYLGSRTVYGAQAMAALAYASGAAGQEQDAKTWAHYALRAFATLMLNEETQHKQDIKDAVRMLRQNFPDVSPGAEFPRSGIPDFTSGNLVRTVETPVRPQRAQLYI